MTGLYSVGEMASFFGLSRPTLIYYDNIGLFHPAQVDEAGRRLYVPTQIPLLRLICLLRDLGLGIKEISEIIELNRTDRLVEYLRAQRDQVDRELDELSRRRDLIDQRIAFHESIDDWLSIEGCPTIRHYAERRVVTEPFPEGRCDDRSVLHPTLMRSMLKLRSDRKVAPVSGFGTYTERSRLFEQEVRAGSGTFVRVPEGIDSSGLKDVVVLPEGLYVCLSYWGMPYDGMGIRQLKNWMGNHNFAPASDVFDFNLMDAVSYNDDRKKDFNCIQVLIEG